ncbi:hypothetical protein C5Y96_12130 [Blastopirellula marina]|uniref:DUF3592 domain-containing protein n=1 Tax=Blastopirellula marina TaxID=124 RepID=A0A2S8FG03_9BACT|nr:MULTISPECIES: DUF3592 domain-containing protein [Pirellulaceae]PQO31099.1 hypothetical protein C5Y96_12130 [Blastopirellula marina]RCS51493.1 DUF3592 domain-containing protein [Bremerella cremea]
MSKLFTSLIVLLFVGFGVAFLGYGIYQLDQASRTTQWPAVRGEILECKLRSHTHDHKETWACYVKYAYDIDGQIHEGDRIAYGYGGTNNKKMHSNLQKKLSRSRYVRVYFDPGNPGESTLATGIHRSAYMPVLFGGAWLAFCGGIFSLIYFGGSIKKIPERLARINHRSLNLVH